MMVLSHKQISDLITLIPKRLAAFKQRKKHMTEGLALIEVLPTQRIKKILG
jgi:hypothetical protein